MEKCRKYSGERIAVRLATLGAIFALGACVTTGGGSLPTKTDDFAALAVSALTWQRIGNAGATATFSGAVTDATDMTDFRMTIDQAGDIGFLSMEPVGSAELPPRGVQVRPVLLDDGRAALMKDFAPLLNSALPLTAKLVAVVLTKDLFAPADIPNMPAVSPHARNLRHISWGTEYEKDGVRWREASFAAADAPGGTGVASASPSPDRILRQARIGAATCLAGSFGGRLITLVPYVDEKSGTALLLAERSVQIDGKTVQYLDYCAKVPAKELLSGF